MYLVQPEITFFLPDQDYFPKPNQSCIEREKPAIDTVDLDEGSD